MIIVKELNGLPLTIEQAGSLLSKRIVSLSGFMEQYKTRYLLLMDKLPAKGILNYEKHHSIVTVLDMLYSQTKAENPEAATQLKFCALLSPWPIPLQFLREIEIIGSNDAKELYSVEDETSLLAKTLQDDIELRLAIDFLTETSLAKLKSGPETSKGTVVIHSAICRWILETQTKAKKWTSYAAEALVVQFRAPIERRVLRMYDPRNIDSLTLTAGLLNIRIKTGTTLRGSIFRHFNDANRFLKMTGHQQLPVDKTLCLVP